MDKVEFTFKTGLKKMLSQRQADLLSRYRLGTYQTRDMGHQPMVTTPMVAEDLSMDPAMMNKEQLHALAKQRGVKVHHLAGAEKVRAALESAKPADEPSETPDEAAQ
jgi:hypothetical protein